MNNMLRLNIGIIGCVSVGKTTLANAILGSQYSDTEIHQNTFIPQIYREARDIHQSFPSASIKIIRSLNLKSNQTITEALNLGQVVGATFPIHDIPKLVDLFDTPNEGITYTITDYPPLEKLSGSYLDLIKTHVQGSDIIVFITDLTRALTSTEEISTLKFLLNTINKNNSRIICLMNKCDDIYHDTTQNDLVFTDAEHERIYIKANNILKDITKSMGITSDKCTPFIPISSEIAFIFRALRIYPQIPLDETHINKLCISEYGSTQWKKNYENIRNYTSKQILELFNNETNYLDRLSDSGFGAFRTLLQNIIHTYEKEFFVHKVNNIIAKLSTPVVNISDLIVFINDHHDFVKTCEDRYKCYLLDAFWSSILLTIQKYIDHIKTLNINIIIDKQLIDFDEFENIHTNLQTECLYFKSLIELVQKLKGDPLDLSLHYKIVTSKICLLYDQLISFSVASLDGTERHTHFSNILHYLSIVHEYAPSTFDKLSIKFLDVFYKKIKLIIPIPPLDQPSAPTDSQEPDLIAVIDYIHTHTTDMIPLYKKLAHMLIYKHRHMISNFPAETYWYNMVMLKNYIKKHRAQLPSKSKYFVDIIYEITTKYIRDQLTDKGVFNVYRQEINMDLVLALLRTPDKYDLMQLNGLEKKIMEIFFVMNSSKSI
jgi:GTPase SAR1 family protein